MAHPIRLGEPYTPHEVWHPPDPTGLFGFPTSPPFVGNTSNGVPLTGWQSLIQQGISTIGSIFGGGRRVGAPTPTTIPPVSRQADNSGLFIVGGITLLAVLFLWRK